MSEISDMVHMNQVGKLAEVSRDFRDIIWWANTKVTASMSTMFLCCGSSGRVGIVDMFAVTFVFKTLGFPPFVLLMRLCHESLVIPLLDFRLGSYEPYRKFRTYFVGVFCSNSRVYFVIYPYRKFTIYLVGFFCSNLECIFCRKYLSEASDIYRKFTIYFEGFFAPTYSVFCCIYIYRTNFIVNKLKKRCYKINNIFPNGAP